jgi:hypothetical protein
MARMPKVAREKIFLVRGFHFCPNFFTPPAFLYYEEYNEGVDIVYDYHYCQLILRVNISLYKPKAVRSCRLPKEVS